MIDNQPESPFNPYESPRADLDSEGYGPAPDRVYGLARPIRIRGKLAAEDIREYYRRTPWQKAKSAFWLFGCLAAVVVIATNWFLQPIVPGFRVTVLIVVLIVVLVVAPLAMWLLHIASKRYPESVERRAVLEEMTFTEEGVLIESDQGKTALRWSAFSYCQCKDQAASLYLENGHNVIYPKRFFADETDWQTFVGLVRCKLPEDAGAARKRAPARGDQLEVEAPDGEVGFDAEGRNQGGPLIRARGALSWEGWKEVRRAIGNPWPDRMVAAGCLVLLVAFFAVLCWVFEEGMPAWLNRAIFWGSWGSAVFALALFVISPRVQLRRQWKRREGPFAPYEVRVWQEGMEFIGPTSRAAVPWSGFSRFARSDRVLLLYQVRNAMVRWIPRSFVSSDQEWETLVRLVREKVPEGGQQTAGER